MYEARLYTNTKQEKKRMMEEKNRGDCKNVNNTDKHKTAGKFGWGEGRE